MQHAGRGTATLDALRLTVARLERRGPLDQVRTEASRPLAGAPSGSVAFGVEPPGAGTSGAGTNQAARARALRATIAAAAVASPVLRFGIAAIDAHLPAGGLSRAALHEWSGVGPDTEHAAAPALLLAALLTRHPGTVIWVTECGDLFAPALAGMGLHPDRIVFVEAGRSTLAVMEEGLRHPGLAAVVGELSGPLGLTASRRLQLGAESGVPAFVLRRSRRFDDPLLSAPSAAATRWRVAALNTPSVRMDAPDLRGMARGRWRLDLVRCRGGVPSSWTLEACDAQDRLGLAAELCHGPAATARDAAGNTVGDAVRTGPGRSRAAPGAVAA